MEKIVTPEDEELIKKLIALSGNTTLNGENKERRRWKFNGEFNLGHVFTILSIIGGVVVFWSTSQLKQQDHEYRITSLERTSQEFKSEMSQNSAHVADALNKLAETQAQAIRNQDKLSLTLDFLAKQKDGKQ